MISAIISLSTSLSPTMFMMDAKRDFTSLPGIEYFTSGECSSLLYASQTFVLISVLLFED